MKIKNSLLILTIICLSLCTITSCIDRDDISVNTISHNNNGSTNTSNGNNGSTTASECFCNIVDANTGEVLVCWNETTDSSLIIDNFYGDCSLATWANLPYSIHNWQSLNSDSLVHVKLVCVEG